MLSQGISTTTNPGDHAKCKYHWTIKKYITLHTGVKVMVSHHGNQMAWSNPHTKDFKHEMLSTVSLMSQQLECYFVIYIYIYISQSIIFSQELMEIMYLNIMPMTVSKPGATVAEW